VNEASYSFHFTSLCVDGEVFLVPLSSPLPHESPVEGTDEEVKTEGELRSMDSGRLEPWAEMSKEGA